MALVTEFFPSRFFGAQARCLEDREPERKGPFLRVNDDENQNLLGQALWQIDGDRSLVRWLWILDRSIKRHSR